MIPPIQDSAGGRSYLQGNQTPGALGGRRDVVQWVRSGTVVTPNRQIVKVAGASWRLIETIGHVRVAPTVGPMVLDIEVKLPGESTYESIFLVKPSIAIGAFSSTGGVIKDEMEILPIGTLVAQGGIGIPTELLIAFGRYTPPSRRISRLIGGAWDTPKDIPGMGNNSPEVMVTNASVWFAINSKDTVSAWDWGVGARTKDGGETWAATPDPGIDQGGGPGGIKWVERDVGGRLWCMVHTGLGANPNIFTQTRIYYSDTDGDSWVLSTTLGTGLSNQIANGRRIIVHPTDQNTIAVIGSGSNIDGGTKGWIMITENRGASWVVNHHSDIRQGQAAQWPYDTVMLSNGRIIAHGPFVIVSPVRWDLWYSDDWGVTWVFANRHTGLNNGNHGGLYVSPDEGTIAFVHTDALDGTKERNKLWVSNDQGETYAEVDLAVEMQEFVGLSSLFTATGFISSTAHEAIYIAPDAGGGGLEMIKLSPVSADGILTDLTFNYPHASQGQDNLGIVPGDPISGGEDLTIELHYRTRAVSQ